MLKIGDIAPDFTAPLDSGETFTLSEQRGKRSVALFFFPRAGSPGCSREAAAFHRAHDEFAERSAVVIGVGPDDAEAVRRFAERDGLPFRLAADPDGAVRRLYDAERKFGLGTSRVTYVIDRDGVVRGAFHNELLMGSHARNALKALAAMEAAE